MANKRKSVTSDEVQDCLVWCETKKLEVIESVGG